MATLDDCEGFISEYTFNNGTGAYAYGVLEIYPDGKTARQRYTSDFKLAQNEVFEVHDVVCYSRSQKRWGV